MSSFSMTKESSVELLHLMKQTKAVDIETATALLQKYADPNHRDESGKTITHFAAQNCHLDVLRSILTMDNAQKYVEQQDNRGMNVFHFAAANIRDDMEVIDALFEHESIRIDVYKGTKMNQTALDIAKEHKNRKIANHLQTTYFHHDQFDDDNDAYTQIQNVKKVVDLSISPNDDHCDLSNRSVNDRSEDSKEEELKKPYITSTGTGTDNDSSNSLTRVLYATSSAKEENKRNCCGEIDCSELWKVEKIKEEYLREANKFVKFYKDYLYAELDNVYLKVFKKHDLNCLVILDEIDDDILQMAGIKKRAHRRFIVKQIRKYLDERKKL